ncbi:MAG: 1,6-anhydro-N-acetylmuramyl-L-alanine amidase AmpD [Pseudomonadota bacterium]|jgi:AmpD protein
MNRQTGWQEPGGWLRRARRIESPNQDERPQGMPVDLLVIHYISLPPGIFRGDAIERLFTNRLAGHEDSRLASLSTLRVSAHFLVRRNGELTQFVGTDRRAWHAGESSLLGRTRCNDFSIGVELEGDGEHPFTQRQYRRLATLIKALRKRHPLALIAGHSDIAPERKQDPGPWFDWQWLMTQPCTAALVRPGAPARPHQHN